MSWLSKRVQTARRRGKNGITRAAAILKRLRVRAGEMNSSRFLSGAINDQREQRAPVQSKHNE